MELNTIPNTGTWGDASNLINLNNRKLASEVDKALSSTGKFKGWFRSESLLFSRYPVPSAGFTAWVGDPYPGTVYGCDKDGIWTDTGVVPSTPSVSMDGYATSDELEAALSIVADNGLAVGSKVLTSVDKSATIEKKYIMASSKTLVDGTTDIYLYPVSSGSVYKVKATVYLTNAYLYAFVSSEDIGPATIVSGRTIPPSSVDGYVVAPADASFLAIPYVSSFGWAPSVSRVDERSGNLPSLLERVDSVTDGLSAEVARSTDKDKVHDARLDELSAALEDTGEALPMLSSVEGVIEGDGSVSGASGHWSMVDYYDVSSYGEVVADTRISSGDRYLYAFYSSTDPTPSSLVLLGDKVYGGGELTGKVLEVPQGAVMLALSRTSDKSSGVHTRVFGISGLRNDLTALENKHDGDVESLTSALEDTGESIQASWVREGIITDEGSIGGSSGSWMFVESYPVDGERQVVAYTRISSGDYRLYAFYSSTDPTPSSLIQLGDKVYGGGVVDTTLDVPSGAVLLVLLRTADNRCSVRRRAFGIGGLRKDVNAVTDRVDNEIVPLLEKTAETAGEAYDTLGIKYTPVDGEPLEASATYSDQYLVYSSKNLSPVNGNDIIVFPVSGGDSYRVVTRAYLQNAYLYAFLNGAVPGEDTILSGHNASVSNSVDEVLEAPSGATHLAVTYQRTAGLYRTPVKVTYRKESLLDNIGGFVPVRTGNLFDKSQAEFDVQLGWVGVTGPLAGAVTTGYIDLGPGKHDGQMLSSTYLWALCCMYDGNRKWLNSTNAYNSVALASGTRYIRACYYSNESASVKVDLSMKEIADTLQLVMDSSSADIMPYEESESETPEKLYIRDLPYYRISGPFSGRIIDTLGDSLTEARRYQKAISKLLGCSVDIHGIGGTTVSGARANAFWNDSRINALNPLADFIVIMGGTNDVSQNSPVGEIGFDNLDTDTYAGAYNVVLLKILHKYRILENDSFTGITQVTGRRHVRIVLCTPPYNHSLSSDRTQRERLEGYASAVLQIGRLWNLPVVNTYWEAGMNDHTASLYWNENDSVHFNDDGYYKLGAMMAHELMRFAPVTDI